MNWHNKTVIIVYPIVSSLGKDNLGGFSHLLANIEVYKSLGFKVKEIIVTRNNETSSQQYKKIGNLIKYIRESIIILE